MPCITQYNTIHVGNHFAVAFEYGDYTGLSDDDLQLFSLYSQQHVMPNTCYEFGQDTDFRKCDITGLMGDCIEIKLFA